MHPQILSVSCNFFIIKNLLVCIKCLNKRHTNYDCHHTAAYLTFARELRTLHQVNTDLRSVFTWSKVGSDLRSVIHNDNFVPEFTPYLKRFEGYMSQIKENIEMSQDRQKTYADNSRRPSPNYKVNDLV
ncbi:transposon Tf2-8 polyprotein [Trichonephila clavipes]|nr:transposon Tf2-8 polyprotein [Trichonephila clavipes]